MKVGYPQSNQNGNDGTTESHGHTDGKVTPATLFTAVPAKQDGVEVVYHRRDNQGIDRADVQAREKCDIVRENPGSQAVSGVGGDILEREKVQ